MIETVTAYFTFALSFLFCFVLSRLEHKKKNSRLIGSLIFYPLLIGLFKRISADGEIVAANINVPHLLAVACLMGLFIAMTFLAKNVFAKYFAEYLGVDSSFKP
jgi:hypothetical protein